LLWIIATPVLLIIAILGLIGLLRFRHVLAANPRDEDARVGRTASVVALIGPLVVWVLISAYGMFHAVPSGEVGVIKQFGRVTGHTSSGFVLTAPWRTITTVNTKTQNYRPTAPLTAFTKETQDVEVLVQVNYHVDSEFAQTLVANVGDDFVDIILIPKIPTIVKEEVVKYAAVDVAPNRENIRQAVKLRLQEALNDKSQSYAGAITIDDFLIDNFQFSKGFTDAIEAKQQAIQNAQAEQNNIAVKQAQAQQAVAEAQGQADAAVVAAQGQAKANNLINASLTPELIQYQAILKLSPNIQIALVPSNGSFILDPSSILKSAAAP